MAWQAHHPPRSARSLAGGFAAKVGRYQSRHRFRFVNAMSSRIEDYALIGDREAAALVGRDGSIDWLCWPRFDSEACFAALLGTKEHGRWKVAPRDETARVTRSYRGNTLILETRFEANEGAATVVDFMPLAPDRSSIVRLVTGERGQVE